MPYPRDLFFHDQRPFVYTPPPPNGDERSYRRYNVCVAHCAVIVVGCSVVGGYSRCLVGGWFLSSKRIFQFNGYFEFS